MHITLKNLVRNYESVHAVQDVSLSIPENRIFGIIGLSGAGKSTLVRLISLLEKPDSGEVWYNDQRVDNLPEKEIIQRRRHIGMIFQNFNLFSSRTAGQNIAYPMEICKYDALIAASDFIFFLACSGILFAAIGCIAVGVFVPRSTIRTIALM
ncbi:MAG: ATP-binding cassette domain-containing protein, partial [Spirochaetales bacterium]|nr:ATP-binding cassette domain-containing protein [Spirochaetales bacterium]